MNKVYYVFLAFVLCSCGIGSYSVSSGKADEGMISFTDQYNTSITVSVDGNNYELATVRTKEWQKARKIKRTARNTVFVSPGKHDVKVYRKGKEIYHKTLFISTSEHKIVSL